MELLSILIPEDALASPGVVISEIQTEMADKIRVSIELELENSLSECLKRRKQSLRARGHKDQDGVGQRRSES